MTLPDWRDESSFGSMIRAGLWLETEVGEGNVFTKAQLREAFAGVAQIDRRLRDLRSHGWQIDTRREDPTLEQDEQRYVKRGAEVWIPGQAKAKAQSTLTAAQRTKTMQQDNYLCRSCGIGSGETYEDGSSTAQLDIARRKVRLPNGKTETQLVTECIKCRIGGRSREEDLAGMVEQVKALSAIERQVLAGWIKADRRDRGVLERLWGHYRALPGEARAVLAAAVNGETKQEG